MDENDLPILREAQALQPVREVRDGSLSDDVPASDGEGPDVPTLLPGSRGQLDSAQKELAVSFKTGKGSNRFRSKPLIVVQVYQWWGLFRITWVVENSDLVPGKPELIEYYLTEAEANDVARRMSGAEMGGKDRALGENGVPRCGPTPRPRPPRGM